MSAVTLGEENHFDISIVDKGGNITDPGCKCELKFDGYIIFVQPLFVFLFVFLIRVSSDAPEFTIGPEVDGKIRVSCTVSKLGDLIMHVLINGQDIRNSPFLITSSQGLSLPLHSRV